MLVAAACLLLLQATDYGTEGMKALESGKYEAAADAFTKAIAADPGDYFAHFNLGMAYSMLHRDADGLAEYRKTLEIKPHLFEAELNAGILLMRQKNPADALPLFEDAVAQKPAEFRPRYYLAEAQIETGALEKAADNYRAALAIDPKSAAAELGWAHALAQQGNLTDAAAHFRQAVQIDPRYHDSLLELAQLYEQARQPSAAIAILREFPENAAAQKHLGELLVDTQQYAAAIPQLEQQYQKNPTADSREVLAVAYLRTEQFDKALPLLEKAAAEEPANYDIHMMYARALRDRKQYAAAAAQFNLAAKLKPDDSKTWTELGGMLYLAHDFEHSLAAFDRAHQLGDNTPGTWFLRALMLDSLRQLKPALEAYQRFLALSDGKSPDQEFQARQRAKLLQREVDSH
jgi:Tfp pilus assembly protein PilF